MKFSKKYKTFWTRALVEAEAGQSTGAYALPPWMEKFTFHFGFLT